VRRAARSRRLAGALLAVLISGVVARAGNTPDTAAAEEPPAPTAADAAEEERLRAVRTQIEELRSRLVAGEEEAGGLLESLDEMDLTLAVLRRESVLLERELLAASRAERIASAAAEKARTRAAAAEAALRAWLVRLYKAGPSAGVQMALMAGTPGGVALAARAAERLAVVEAHRVVDLRAERERLETTERSHQEALAHLESLGAELDRRRAEMASARATKGELLKGVRTRQETGREALAALIQVEADLQALLKGLPDREGVGPSSRGLTRFRGLLNWPVRGPVALGFGNVRHPKFDTQVPHPGIEIACPPGDTVRALFDGRVVFSSWFKGYGQMIVIDHGDEYLSIYGQLGERLVETGTEVRRDEPIARSGEEGTFGVTGLYFEVRHKGHAEDPRPWLRKSGAQAAVTGERDKR
jgi:murein hydrolase activator